MNSIPVSWLFAPGHRDQVVSKALTSGADAVILDLEDAVPADGKVAARRVVSRALETADPWVRINAVRTDEAELDLEALALVARRIRIPKAESAHDVDWVLQRCPGVRIVCAIESTRGLAAAPDLAGHPAVDFLALGGLDLQRDLGIRADSPVLEHARARLVLAAAAAGLPGPVDSVYPNLSDDEGLATAARSAELWGFSGKSAIHPRQLNVIHAAFTPTADDIAWAERVLVAFAASTGDPTTTDRGEFVDVPVAAAARRLLDRNATSMRATGQSTLEFFDLPHPERPEPVRDPVNPLRASQDK